jgi:RHS repeat-associated protein
VVTVTGFAPEQWTWAGQPAFVVTTTDVYTVNLWLREDGLRIDRLLLTTDTNYVPTSFGPTETAQLTGQQAITSLLTRTIVYTYDNLYRLTDADYSTGELYEYEYDPLGNRLKQIINGDTTDYLYDAANRLASVDSQSYTFDDNGNLLATGVLTNTFDAANRLISSSLTGTTVQPVYNGVGDRIGQTVGTTTTHFALDVMGLPEVIYTSDGNAYLHLPGVIVAESSAGETRYLLSDGLGSIRQAVDDNGAVVAYNEFDPYGNPVQSGSELYGYTGEWWQDEVGLLYLRARWYTPGIGTFLQKDPHPGETSAPATLNGYNYVHQNPVNLTDPSGEYVGPIDGYVEGLAVSFAYPLLPGLDIPNISVPKTGLAASLTAALYNIVEKLAIKGCITGLKDGYRWPRMHQTLWARELVYDFAHMQSAQFAPEMLSTGGADVTSDILNIEVYISLYSGPIVGLGKRSDIRGYLENATTSAGFGASIPASDFTTVGLGLALNTNSSKRPDLYEAFNNLFRDAFDPQKSTEVTSLVFGGSGGITPRSSFSPSGKVSFGGNIGWSPTTYQVGLPTDYTAGPDTEPTVIELNTMARDITTGIRFQAIWSDFWNDDIGRSIFTPSLSNLSYGSPLGPSAPFLPSAGQRVNAVENLYGYWGLANFQSALGN